ncbi:hypothetical protein niasHT_035974 [Heterodera trifolii]|uniref:K Homology domain-containing protein n=1 Tax=Heterodera trifolii TaxID=157864 RepID=A0ABD2IKL1_9BILA
MEVEVKQQEGFYLKAFVTDVLENSLDVVYDRGCRKPETVEFSQCRAVTIENAQQKRPSKCGDIVDALVPIDKNNDDFQAYKKMKIREIKGDFAVVCSVDNAGDGNVSALGSEVIPLDQCRHPAMCAQIDASSVKQCAISVPDDLVNYFVRGEDTFKMLLEAVSKVLIKFDQENKQIVVKSFFAGALKKVQILKDTFLLHSRQKMMLLNRHEETMKMLAAQEPPDEFFEEFEVQTAMMGLAIGSQGANISSVRKLEGVKEILVDDSQRAQGFCKIKIYATNPEIAEQARNMLEFLQKHVKVPHDKVGQMIGKQGKSIQDIVDKSGVVRVQIGEENPEHGLVDFTFTGTRESIANAELMVEFLLKHIKEMDEIREEEEECKRKLFSSRHSPFPYQPNNGWPSHQLNASQRASINGGGGGATNRRVQNSKWVERVQQPMSGQPVPHNGGGKGGGGGQKHRAGGGGGGGGRRSQAPQRNRRDKADDE